MGPGAGRKWARRMAASVGAWVACVAWGGPPPNYGHDFVTVGAPGNRPALDSERFYGSAVVGFPNLGQVNYEFRISRTETTVQQWFDFVQVAYPFAEALGYSRGGSVFAGRHIYTNTPPSNPVAVWHITPGTEQLATTMSFRFAVWYCNWLHNGRPTANVTLDTFTTGAYDLTTMTRRPGALYWIPSLDEWTKATYYDPNRYGPGQEGYWLYSGMSQTPLVGGPPGSPGAQTSSGGWYNSSSGQLWPSVGAYPGTQSPWGLLDTSGGVREYTDSPGRSFPSISKMLRGDGLSLTDDDQIDYVFTGTGFENGLNGFRIASAIPAPASLIMAFVVVSASMLRRGRCAMP